MAQLTKALKLSVPLIKRRLGPLWFASAWPYIAMAICFMITGFLLRILHDPSAQTDPVSLWQSLSVLAKIGVLFAYLASISLPHGFATAGAIVIAWADLQGEGITWQSVLLRIRHVLPRLLVLSLCIGGICMLGGMFFLVPGILGFAFLSFAIPVLMIQDTKVSTALRRGIDLATTTAGAVLGLYTIVLFAAAVSIVAFFILGALVPSNIDLPWWVIPVLFWVLLVPIVSIVVMGETVVLVHLYRDIPVPRGEVAATET